MIGSSDDICRELYEAREQLDSRGRNLPNVTNDTYGKGWIEYLADVGLQRELYEAREQLADRGSWSRNNCYNWEKYLADVGLQRMTVHRWLEHYEPTEQRLLTV